MMFSFKGLRPIVVVLFVCAGGILVGPAYATGDGGEDEDKKGKKGQIVHTTSSLRASLLYGTSETTTARPAGVASGRRIVPLAFGLSAVIPGLGQAYNRQWVKAAVAVGVEAAVIAGYTSWRSKGVDGRDAYQDFAHTLWSPLRYAEWLNDYIVYLETEFTTPISATPITITDEVRGVDFQNPDSWTPEQQLFVRGLILEIRNAEDNVYHPETGASFSHKLPFFGEQQYYELVGKYFQFAPGWSDYSYILNEDGNPTWIDPDGNFLLSIDPEMTAGDGSKPNVTDTFFRYAEDHGEANDYLRRASRVSMLFVLNHLIAAVDAAVFAKIHNNRIQTSVLMSQGVDGALQPQASLRVKL